MGCMCCSLSSFVSIVLHALERISLCTVCAMLVCCLLFTIMSVLLLGVGIGYHYCFVQNSVDQMAKAAKAAGALRSGGSGMDSLRTDTKNAIKRAGGVAHRIMRREADNAPPVTNKNLTDPAYQTTSVPNSTSYNYTQYLSN